MEINMICRKNHFYLFESHVVHDFCHTPPTWVYPMFFGGIGKLQKLEQVF
jgi:hypothetical protein